MTNRTTPVGTVDEELDLLILRARERQAAVAVPDCIGGAQQRLDAARQQLLNRVERLEARVAATTEVIGSGYRGVNKTEQCVHERFGFEDCIACYDEALLAALTGEHNG